MLQTNEMHEKLRRVRAMMERECLDATAIANISNFAWLTCGGVNYVGLPTDVGAVTAVVTREAKFIVCDNIEAPRQAEEAVEGQGFEFRTYPWYEGGKDAIISEIANGGRLGSDVTMKGARNISAAMQECRLSLLPEEIERYRWLGRNAGECLSEACRMIEPGMTEHEIAGILDKMIYERGIVPTLTLIATDERISRFRHPHPTDRKLERYAMLVTGARKWGLIASATRIVHFGEVPPELRRKHDAVARVDAAMIAATRPGARMGDIFRTAMQGYADNGFADEWQRHHQGGPTGYRPREFLANESTDALVLENQAIAWNPSITGTKTEDTIIATTSGPIILTETPDWPKVDVDVDGQTIQRPDILVR